jgi:hypothetical protein
MGIADRVRGDFYEFILDRAVEVSAASARNCELLDTEDEDGELSHLKGRDHGFYVEEYVDVQAKEMPFINLGDWDHAVVAELHFMPNLRMADGTEKSYDLSTPAATLTEREGLVAQGLLGVVTYLTLVEANILSKPDYLIGTTSTRMALLGERLGLHRAFKEFESTDTKHWPKPTTEDLQNFIDYLADIKNDDTGVPDTISAMRAVWIRTELHSRTSDEMLHTLITTVFQSAEDEPESADMECVIGTYEEFKNASLAFYKDSGERLMEWYLRRRQRELGKQALL